MRLDMFLSTAENIDYVKIYDYFKGPKDFIYKGSYADFSTEIHELNLDGNDILVFKWEVVTNTVIIGVSKI